MINKILGLFGYQLIKIKNNDMTYQIKSLLLDKGINQKHIANHFKVSKSLISQAISGKHDPMPELQNKIYEYLKSL